MKKQLFSLLASFALLGSSQLAQAQTGASLNFDGTNDYVSVARPISSDFTIEFWVKTTQTAGGGQWYNGVGLVDGEVGGVTNDFGTALVGGNFAFGVGNPDVTITSTTTVNDGNWHHVAATRVMSTGAINIYVDGNLEASGTGNTNALTGPPGLTIGSLQTGFNYFNGNIDEVRIWSVARSQGLLQQYMNCSVQDTALGLVACYRFNDGMANANNAGATTLFDAGVNKLNGTLTNFGLTGTASNFSTDHFMDYFSLQSTLTDANCNNTLGGAVVADFNGDGSKDLIMSDWNFFIRMYLNDGKGNFSSTYTNPLPAGGNLESADVDNDGDIDLVVANSNSVTVYANNGSAVFTAITGNFFQGTGQATVTKVADLNGDSKNDLIVGNGGTGTTDSSLIYYNTGTTGNAAFTYMFGIAPNPARNSVDVGDVNGDGYPDIVTGGSSWGAQLLFNVNNGSSFSMQTPPAGYSGGARFVDWNQDGKLDYMNYDQYNNYGLRYVLNNGNGIFSATPVILLQDFNAHVAKLGDLNGDGFLDIVIDNWGGNAKAYLSNGCAVTVQNSCNYALGRADNDVALADYNGDGNLDIFCQARCNSSSVYLNYLTAVTGTPLPNISISGTNPICNGQSTTLTASGATTFTWTGGPVSSTYTVSPTTNTSYSVMGANSVGCTNGIPKVITVTVNPLPLITSQSGNVVACGDVSATFTVSSPGNNTYQWHYVNTVAPFDGDTIDGSYTEIDYTTDSMTIQQLITGLYGGYAVYCVVTNTANCSVTSAPDTITVNALPTITATALNDTLCIGFSDTLNAGGGVSYVWSNNAGSATTASVAITPTVTDTYTVSGTDGNGCVNTATVTVVVENCGTGINEPGKGEWVVYPNPGNGNLTLRAAGEIGSVEVYNALGALVYKTNTKGTELHIDLSSEAAGLYYLHAQGRKTIISKQ
jgi:hypothetical protein